MCKREHPAIDLERLDWSYLLNIVLSVVPSLLCITFHEVSHGYVAYRPAIRRRRTPAGSRSTLLKHIDPMGLLMMVVQIRLAKPVPVNMMRFRNPSAAWRSRRWRTGVERMLLALVFLLLYGLLYRALYSVQSLLDMIWLTAYISLALAIFNIIPVSPLDGSKVLFALLPDAAYAKLMRYERYGMILLLVLVATGVLGKPLTTVTEGRV